MLKVDPPEGYPPEEGRYLRGTVTCCFQEEPTEFLTYTLHDPGAWPEPPICERISRKIAEPWKPELSEREQQILEHIRSSAKKAS